MRRHRIGKRGKGKTTLAAKASGNTVTVSTQDGAPVTIRLEEFERGMKRAHAELDAKAANKGGAKKKGLTYELVDRESERGAAAYEMLEELLAAPWHEEISEARIVLAWHYGWKQDADGRLTLGQCKKTGDLDRELHEFDFAIVLNFEFWTDFETDDAKRKALLDHELSHAAVQVDDKSGEPKTDAKGRVLWRTRKHDIEEFTGVVARHGIYKRDLEAFAKALLAKRDAPLFAGVDSEKAGAGAPAEH